MSKDSKVSFSEQSSSAKRKVYALRVAELQGFLQSCNLNKNGKKDELRQRALTFINNAIQSGSFLPVSAKLDLYYQKRFPQAATLPTAVPRHGLGGVQKQLASSSNSAVDVQFKALPFHEKLETLLKPILLPSFDSRASMAPRNMELECRLTPQQGARVEEGRRTVPSVYGPGHKSDLHFTVEVLVRFAACELSCTQDDQYPPKCQLSVNGRTVIMPGYQMAKPSGEMKKHGQPVEITANMLLSGRNKIQLVCSPVPEITRKYVVTVELCLKRSSAELLQQVCQRVRSADMCRALIKDKLTGGGDAEIATTSLRSSLKCPLGKTRLVYPGRSMNCKHVNCFDMANFLQMNEKKARWVCPICDCLAIFDSLMIDGLMKEVLDKCPSSVDHIEYMADGTWTPYNPRDANQRRATGGPPSSATNAVGSAAVSTVSDDIVPVVFDLSDSCHSLEPCEQEQEAGGDGRAAAAGPDVIDLTMDTDSDDDDSAAAAGSGGAGAAAAAGGGGGGGGHGMLSATGGSATTADEAMATETAAMSGPGSRDSSIAKGTTGMSAAPIGKRSDTLDSISSAQSTNVETGLVLGSEADLSAYTGAGLSVCPPLSSLTPSILGIGPVPSSSATAYPYPTDPSSYTPFMDQPWPEQPYYHSSSRTTGPSTRNALLPANETGMWHYDHGLDATTMSSLPADVDTSSGGNVAAAGGGSQSIVHSFDTPPAYSPLPLPSQQQYNYGGPFGAPPAYSPVYMPSLDRRSSAAAAAAAPACSSPTQPYPVLYPQEESTRRTTRADSSSSYL